LERKGARESAKRPKKEMFGREKDKGILQTPKMNKVETIGPQGGGGGLPVYLEESRSRKSTNVRKDERKAKGPRNCREKKRCTWLSKVVPLLKVKGTAGREKQSSWSPGRKEGASQSSPVLKNK